MELRQLLAILWRRKWAGILVFLAFFLTIMGISLTVPKTYDTSARILLRPSQGAESLLNVLELPPGLSGESDISDTTRSTIIALAQVVPVASEVCRELNLERERVRAKILKAIPFASTILESLGIDPGTMVKPVTGEELLSRSLFSLIFPRPYVSIDQYEETNIVEIEALSEDPRQARDIAAAMAHALIRVEQEILTRDFASISATLERNLESIRQDYYLALQQSSNFKKDNNFVDLDTEVTNTIDRFVELTSTRENIQTDLNQNLAVLADARRQLDDIPQFQKTSETIARNELIDSAKESLLDLYKELAGYKTYLTDNHPDVIETENKISYLKTMINDEAMRSFSSETSNLDPRYETLIVAIVEYYTEIAANEANLEALDQLLTTYMDKLNTLPETIVELSKLDMDVSVFSTLVESFSSYTRRVAMLKGVSLSNIMMVAAPEIPRVSDKRHRHPNHQIAFIISVFLGTFFGFITILVLEYVDDTIYAPAALGKFEGPPVLGSIGAKKTIRRRRRTTVLDAPPLMQCFKRIQLELDYRAQDKTIRHLGVTSLFAEEGKRFFAVNYGIVSALQGKNVVVVEADPGTPKLHRWFDLKTSPGLHQFCAENTPMVELVQPTGVSGLSIIVGGQNKSSRIPAIDTVALAAGIKELENAFDLVILVSAPAFVDTDAFRQISSLDASVLVVKSGRVREAYYREFLSIAEIAKTKLAGCVMNNLKGVPSPFMRDATNPVDLARTGARKTSNMFKRSA